jgi:hypothetical protein
MKKLILLTATLLIAGQASAFAAHNKHHHRGFMSAHARYEPGTSFRARAYPPEMVAPAYGYAPSYGYGGGVGDDYEAEGRTSGG